MIYHHKMIYLVETQNREELIPKKNIFLKYKILPPQNLTISFFWQIHGRSWEKKKERKENIKFKDRAVNPVQLLYVTSL